VLDFLDPDKTSFTVVGPMPGLARAVPGDFVVVNNMGEGMAPSDAYQLASGERNIARIDKVDTAAALITLQDNPFARQSTPMPSPTQRFQVIGGPVTYRCAAQADGTLAAMRRWWHRASPTAACSRSTVGPPSAARWSC
jgi:MSHA biogenesis protein MshO